MILFSFEKLEVYQKSRKLVGKIYKLIEDFPPEERYALCDQLRRSIISVPSNVAEESGRTSVKEKLHHLEYSYGSLMEAFCQLQIAMDLGYISEEQLNSIRNDFIEVSKLLNGLSKSFRSKL